MIAQSEADTAIAARWETVKAEAQAVARLNQKRVERVKTYHEGVLKCFADHMGYAYLAGAELLALKAESSHGQFEKLKETEFPDMPHSSIGRYMLFAKGIQAKYPTVGYLRSERLLTNGEFDLKEQEKVIKAVHDIADGKTLTQLYRDLGVIRDKKDVGRKQGEKPKKLSLSEQVALRKQQATEDWAGIAKALLVYKDKFTILTDDDSLAQIAMLEQALKARKAWIKQPANQRDAKAIERMFDSSSRAEKQVFSAYVNRYGRLLVHAYNVDMEIDALKSPSVYVVIRHVEAGSLEEAYAEAERRYRERHCDITFAGKDQKLPAELKR